MIQSVLDPAGPQAERIVALWNLFLITVTVVYAIVMAFVAVAVIKALRRAQPDVSHERRLARAVGIATVVVAATLVGLLFVDAASGGAEARFARGEKNQLEIQVTGRQWWWEVNYPDHAEPHKSFKTANEIRIPVGKPVLLRLSTRDVIHSLWIPRLHGKRDLIPGRVNKIRIQADAPGVFRAQCGEYCGLQHAHMSLVVVAQEARDFERWKIHQQTPAAQPVTPLQQKGHQLFLSLPCAKCHSIVGTDAFATVGPDLTHLASRPTLAAGTLINNRGNLAGWIANPQSIKPGVQMPINVLSGDEMEALLAYLESLE